ncbi:MAG: EamA family transporter [Betaproteobacteria bacterium]|nr:EamA family transporter [Betaproteobacteria bacterium]
MSALALFLVIGAALCHASWNYLLKKSGGGIGILTLSGVLGLFWVGPFAIWQWWAKDFSFTWPQIGMVIGSGIIHTAYFLLLDRAYRSGGDLSIVYPLARATGPLLTILLAALLLGERMGPVALGGAILIGVSAFLLTGNPAKLADHSARRAAGFALMTGGLIAVYTIWDKQAMAAFLIPPIVFDWAVNISRVAVLVPLANIREPGAITRAWHAHKGTALAIGFLSPLSYILVLTAMVFTPVSYVAPGREISILFAALMGTQLLNEGEGVRRTVAAAGMVLGIAALALG